MLQINNQTSLQADIALFPDEEARDTLYVMAKGTYDIDRACQLANEQKPLSKADIYYGEPGLSSIKYPSDYHTGKPSTDIIMLGSACAPDRHAVRQLDVLLQVGTVKKNTRVFGSRHWQNGRISHPEIFETMRMRYENAYGGQDTIENEIRAAENRNPIGKGFMGHKNLQQMDGAALPNLEDPNNLIRSPSDKPQPFCFSAIAPNWQPRVSFAGTYDEDWETQRAPYLPLDYNSSFMCSSSYGLNYPQYLSGDESINIVGMHPSGALNFHLPTVCLRGELKIANVAHQLCFNIETLILEPNELSLSLVWRAKMVYGKHLSKIIDVTISH